MIYASIYPEWQYCFYVIDKGRVIGEVYTRPDEKVFHEHVNRRVPQDNPREKTKQVSK